LVVKPVAENVWDLEHKISEGDSIVSRSKAISQPGLAGHLAFSLKIAISSFVRFDHVGKL
jgi:hypothetical protein